MWRLCSIEWSISRENVKSDAEAAGICIGSYEVDGEVEVDGAVGVGKVDEEGAEVSGTTVVVGVSNLLPLAFLGPLNVIVGSSRFQQFFLMYAKLMAGLRLSRDLESDWTPLALHRAVIKAGNPSLEESCCAVIEIWWEMRYPTFISIFMMMP